MQEEPNVVRHQAPPRQHLDGEEIGSGEHVQVPADEFLPTRRLTAPGAGAMWDGAGCCPQSAPKSDDPAWPAQQRCGRTPNPSFRGQNEPPVLSPRLKSEVAQDSYGIANHRTCGP